MKIELRSLRVVNGGPLRDVCIHFTPGERGVTVLAGANGSGKTTALEMIVALAELLAPFSELPPIRPILTRTGYAQMDWLVDEEQFSVYYGQKPSDVKLPGHFFGRSTVGGEISEEVGGDISGKIRKLIREQEVDARTLTFYGKTSDGDDFLSTDGLDLPSIIYFPYTRVLLPVSGDQIQREITMYQWVYFYQIAGEFRGSLGSYLIWLEYALPQEYKHIIEFLNSLDFDGKRFSVSRRDLTVVVTTRDGDTHDVANLSSGEQNYLILLLELRRRLLPHSIVLIDEIENSLHPAFQYRLAEGLKKMQEAVPFQLIVTTHSPAFVEIFGPQSTRILTEF